MAKSSAADCGTAACVRYDERRGVIVIRPPERLTVRAADEARTRIAALARLAPDSPVVVDWRGVDHACLTAEVVRTLAWKRWPVSTRIAFVAPTDVLFGLARMYTLQSDQPMEAFRDCGQALAWVKEDEA